MSIGVQSYAELYTTLIGWQMYDSMWNLLTQTGLAFLPFIGVIIRNIVQPYESQETKSAAGTSLRRMEVEVIVMLLLIFFGVSPALTLDASMVSFTPICQTEGRQNTYHPGDTGTTYDKAFSLPTGDIRVPLWWYAVLSVSSGATASANTMVACVPDYRKMVTQVDMTQISSPALKQELQQFEQDCFLPARTLFLKDAQTDSTNNPTIQNDVSKFGSDDTEWQGSHAFQDTYYKNLKSSQPIPGFSYNPSDDVNAGVYPAGTATPAYGIPSCSDWWNDAQSGLKTKLYNNLPANFTTEFKDIFSGNAKLQDDVVKRIASNGGGGFESADQMSMPHDYSLSHLTAAIGIDFSSLSAYPTIYAIAQAAPIAQGLLLLMVFAFLPLALVFSGYQAKSFIIGAVIIFSIYFWSYIWHLVGWTDSVLNLALYDNNWFELRSPNATLVNIIIGFLQIVAPLFFLGFMSALGVAAGNITSTISGAMDSLVNNPSTDLGNEAARVVKQAGNIVFKATGSHSDE